jgi:heme oxygenase
MSTFVIPIMERLKAETRDLHDRAETHSFQRAFVRGRLPLISYTRYLEQMYVLHSFLESRLRRLVREIVQLHTVVEDHQYQESYLLRDLHYYELDPARIEPLPATQAFCSALHEFVHIRPFVPLGCHYVLEGSNNGSQFIARAIRTAYNLPDNEGANYLDPYGQEQSAHWATFKLRMNAVDFSEAQATQLVDGAVMTFEGIIRICDELVFRMEPLAIELEGANPDSAPAARFQGQNGSLVQAS